jgi:hypothetical protein
MLERLKGKVDLPWWWTTTVASEMRLIDAIN